LSDTSEPIGFDTQTTGLGDELCPRDDLRPCDSTPADEQVALALFEVWIAGRKAA
jgi:hypothetical protein